MYCSNCGEKINDESKFCYKCGKKINIDNQIDNEVTINSKEIENEYSNNLIWYNIYNYVVIPILILLNINSISLLNYDIINSTTLTTFALVITFITLKVALCISMYKKKQGTLKLFKISIYLEFGTYIFGNILLALEIALESGEIILMIVNMIPILIEAIWIRENVIYFEKRKEIFKN